MEKVYAIRYSFATDKGKDEIRFLREVSDGKLELSGMIEARIFPQQDQADVIFDQVSGVHGERNEQGYPTNLYPLVRNLNAPFNFKVKMELLEMHDHGISIVANKPLRAAEVTIERNPQGNVWLTRMAL